MSTWLLPLLLLAAGLARAVHDVGTHQPAALAKFGPFWDARTSWQLKYKDGRPVHGPKFPGATTWLVAFTDGWHLSNTIAWLCADAAVVLAAWPGDARWWAVVAVAVRRLVFQPAYAYLRKDIRGL